MIQEDYVTFEQAKALKELGFPQWELDHSVYYELENNGEYQVYSEHIPFWDENIYLECPTLSLVQKWLRVEKCLDISVYRYGDKCISRIETEPGIFREQYEPIYFGRIWVGYPSSDVGKYTIKLKDSNDKYLETNNPEQMLSIGVDECIKLLKEQKDGEI